ncbi:Dilute domain-containing protein [Entamoeba marina]
MSLVESLRRFNLSKEEKLVHKISSNDVSTSKEKVVGTLLEMYNNILYNKNIVAAFINRLGDGYLSYYGYAKLLLLGYRIIRDDTKHLFLESLKGYPTIFTASQPDISVKRKDQMNNVQLLLTQLLAKQLDWMCFLYENYSIVIEPHTPIEELIYPKRRENAIAIIQHLLMMFNAFDCVDWNAIECYQSSLTYQITDILLNIYSIIFTKLFKYCSTLIQSIFLFPIDQLEFNINVLLDFQSAFRDFKSVVETKEVVSRFMSIPFLDTFSLEPFLKLIHQRINCSKLVEGSNFEIYGEISSFTLRYEEMSKNYIVQLDSFANRAITTLTSSKCSSSQTSSISITPREQSTPKDSSSKSSSIIKPKVTSQTKTVTPNKHIFLSPIESHLQWKEKTFLYKNLFDDDNFEMLV